MGVLFLFLSVLFVCFTIKLLLSMEAEDDYIAKFWELIISIIFFVVSVFFANKSFENKAHYNSYNSENNYYIDYDY